MIAAQEAAKQAQAEKELEDARQQAEKELEEAKLQAEKELEDARLQAEKELEDARLQAEQELIAAQEAAKQAQAELEHEELNRLAELEKSTDKVVPDLPPLQGAESLPPPVKQQSIGRLQIIVGGGLVIAAGLAVVFLL